MFTSTVKMMNTSHFMMGAMGAGMMFGGMTMMVMAMKHMRH